MIVRAFSVFEGIVYHCALVDPANPCRPLLEVEAVVRPGDVDDGPLLLPLAEYATLAGGTDAIRPCLPGLRAAGRIVDHLGVAHLSFPFWTPVHLDIPGAPSSGPDGDGDAR
ncbi:MAG: hypothetical protein KDA94_08395 [Acidimicrobiales bacterium]|nr:hypothetical protein [Acidimicrobiales bacterium]